MQAKICHLIDANLDTAYFRSIATHCDKSNFPVMIGSIAPAGDLQVSMKNLQTATFSLNVSNRKFYLRAIQNLVGLLRKEKVSILHAHCFDPTFIGLIAARLAGVKFVFTRHHSDHNIRIGAKWHTKIDSFCARKADHVIAVSEATKEIMMEIEKVSSEKITVVYNGMEKLREPTAESIAQTRENLGKLHKTVILLIGRLHEEKGHRYLFEAIPKIKDKVGEVSILLAGDGPQKVQIEAEAKQFGVEKDVHFLGRRYDIPELLQIASIAVMPSLAESFGFVALEAMSMGTPLVASDAGGLVEVVKDGETGIIVPKADSSAIAEAVGRVLQSFELQSKFKENCPKHVEKFTFEKMIRGYERVYKSLLYRGELLYK